MDIRARIAALLGLDSAPEGEDLTGFSADQLDKAEKTAQKQFAAARKDRDVEAATAAVEEIEAVGAEKTKRAELSAKVDEELAALEARTTPVAEDPTPDPTPADPEPTPAPVEPTPTPEPTPEPVVAAAPPEPEPTPAVPAPSPSPVNTTPLVVVTAAGDVQNHSAGAVMTMEHVGPAFKSKSEAILAAKDGSRKGIAHMDWLDQYRTENRFLDERDNSDVNTEKINAVIADAQARTAENLRAIVAAGRKNDKDEIRSLTAAGGLCAPVNVRYEVYQVGSTARPIRDGLTRFGATRGGIRFNSPPVLSDLATGVNVYTHANDVSGYGAGKGCVRIGCGADKEVKVSNIPLCMIVGNYQRMYFPENFAAWWALGNVQHSRKAEQTLWDRMVTLSTSVTTAEHFGATRDVLASVTRAAIQYRNRFRIDRETPLRILLPDWAEDLMLTDLARQEPGDAALEVTDADLVRYFAVRGIAVTYTLDGQEMNATQDAGGLNPWLTNLEAIMFAEGTFLFLDGGSLDFGTEIRDFTQIRANDSGAFMETFEEVAFVGNQSIHLTMDVCPSGITQAPATISICTSGS